MYHNSGYFGGGEMGRRWVYVRVGPNLKGGLFY